MKKVTAQKNQKYFKNKMSNRKKTIVFLLMIRLRQVLDVMGGEIFN